MQRPVRSCPIGWLVLGIVVGWQSGAAGQNLGTYPDWTTYGLVEGLVMGRDNQSVDRPLVEEVGVPDNVLLSARDAQFPFGGGVRAFYGQRRPEEGGWEIGYLGLYGQSAGAFATIAEPRYLQVPDPLGTLLTAEGESATFSYDSVINGAEANVFLTSTRWRSPTAAWLTVDWLAGFRYVGVEEDASLALDCCAHDGPPQRVRYDVGTRNQLFGGQVGTRARWTWERWALEGWAKAGLFGNAQKQFQPPLVDYVPAALRPARWSSGAATSFVGDVNLSLVYRLTDTWGIRAGYNLLWIEGLALAPDQFDFSVDANAGRRLDSGGGMFLHGANLGLEARW